ncbi:MAG: winged helix-turn-helix domain-containing protein [Actinomycetota bacterium]
MAVELVRWPGEKDRLERLREQDTPRLLLVDDEDIPPSVTHCLEDWVRVPSFERDILARSAALTARAARHGGGERPRLDDSGILRFRDDWVSLGPVDAALCGALLEQFGELVARDDLSEAAWPGTPSARNNLDVQIMRLRRRLATVGLRIRTVRGRGYVLEVAREPATR